MLEPGKILQGRYVIERLLGRGGMGEVYKAHDNRLTCSVAVKKSRFKDEEMRRAFHHEARLLANLNHPSTPKASDHFHEDGSEYLVMDFIEGDDLHTQLDEWRGGRPFDFEDILNWTEQILSALDLLHARSILHRDIKPDNLKILYPNRIILLDFGLAKGVIDEMTRTSPEESIWGYAEHYSPPEQIEGVETTPRSDLFSLAATMYHLLTGVQPPSALKRKKGKAELWQVRSLRPQVPQWFADVLMRALELDEARRPASAAEMLHDILSGKGNWRDAGRKTNLMRRDAELITLPDEVKQPDKPIVLPVVPPQPPVNPFVPPPPPISPQQVLPPTERLPPPVVPYGMNPWAPSPPFPPDPAEVMRKQQAKTAFRRRLLLLAAFLVLAGIVAMAVYWLAEPKTGHIEPPPQNKNGPIEPPSPTRPDPTGSPVKGGNR